MRLNYKFMVKVKKNPIHANVSKLQVDGSVPSGNQPYAANDCHTN